MSIHTTHINSLFSVYRLVDRVYSDDSMTLYSRSTMNQISYQIENATRIDGARTRLFSGFQRMSKFLPQADRYRQIAQRAESIHVFGIMDADLPDIPNIIYVPLDEDHQLAREWFLVSYSDKFASVLATEELTDMDAPDHLRQFQGIWTFDVAVASLMDEWLSNTVDIPRMPYTEHEHNNGAQSILVQNIMDRMMAYATKPNRKKTDTQEQLRIVIENTLKPLTPVR